MLYSREHVTQDSFKIADIAFDSAGGFRVESDVQENVLTFSLFVDLVCQPAASPDFHFIHAYTCLRNPTRDTINHTFKCGFVQFGLDNANEFIIAHEGIPPFHGIAPVQTVGLPGAERHVVTYLSCPARYIKR